MLVGFRVFRGIGGFRVSGCWGLGEFFLWLLGDEEQ